MAQNKLTVFGTAENLQTIYYTGSTERTNLFNNGLEVNAIAKAQDVLTPLYETSLVTTAILDWIKDNSSEDFETSSSISVDTFKNRVLTALNKKVFTEGINTREASISKGTGYLKYNISSSSWSWDNNTYQVVNSKLTSLINIGSKGLVYFNGSTYNYDNTTQYTYVDKTETDAEGNVILYLKTTTW